MQGLSMDVEVPQDHQLRRLQHHIQNHLQLPEQGDGWAVGVGVTVVHQQKSHPVPFTQHPMEALKTAQLLLDHETWRANFQKVQPFHCIQLDISDIDEVNMLIEDQIMDE